MDARRDILKFIFEQNECVDLDLSEDYIDKLCSIGIHNLEREPARLMDAKIRLEEAMREEAFKNYACFLEAHQFSKDVKQEILGIEDKLNKFIDKIPVFQERLTGFSSEAKDISKRWRQASLMLSKHNQLLGFLEIPQLMDSCVRKGYYDEALQLYSYILRIDRLHGKDAPLIKTISNELSQCKELMINQLLRELYGNIQLPVALKIISYLRRINVYGETELRIKFLNARETWLRNLVKEVSTTNPILHMGKLIEIYRINLFNTVTQYRALFADEEISPLSSASFKVLSIQESPHDPDNRDFGDSTILTSWISNKVDSFLCQLQDTLDKCLSTEYSSLYPFENLFDPCFYFGLSMSRIGADCRPDISIIFQRVILTKFNRSVEAAIDKFEANMENFSLPSVNMMTSSSSSPAIPSLASGSGSSVPEARNDYDPPFIILNFPPLANLCNNLLEALNQLRKLIPLNSIIKFRNILNQSFIRSTQILLNYHKTESTSVASPEAEVLKKMIQAYIHHLVPHIQKCLSALVPVQQLSKSLGLSVLEYNRLRKTRKDISISDLDVDAIRGLLDHLAI